MYEPRRYLLMTLDPVHVGAGGYRLGRVDQTIVREPGTGLPKVPGSSLAGVARRYAAARYEKAGCAGSGHPGAGHCGQPTCPICYTFGHARVSGTVSVFDATLLLFPVHSMAGPVWAAAPGRLRDAGFAVDVGAPADVGATHASPSATLTWDWPHPLNLGWLMLPTHVQHDAVRPPPDIHWDADAQTAWDAVRDRLVLVDEGLFSQVVNANLEVRTSTAVDPATGASEPGALFTHEAIPRGAWLVFDVVEDDYRTGASPWPVEATHAGAPLGGPLGETWQRPHDVARAGLDLARWLGVGGMGSRGFGRIRLAAHWTPGGSTP